MTDDPRLRLPLLHALGDDHRRALLEAGSERSLAKGEILFHEGDPADAMYGLLEGRLKLVRYAPSGREMLVHLVRPGQTFADAALFGDATYPATAEAVEPSRLWMLPRSRLFTLIRTSPDLALGMIGSVSMWTRRLVETLELLTQRRVEERLAVYLLSRSGRRPIGEGGEIALSEPRHLIAAQIGTAPEVLSRTFRRLEDEGLLEASPDRVRILDPDRLRKLAEWIGS